MVRAVALGVYSLTCYKHAVTSANLADEPPRTPITNRGEQVEQIQHPHESGGILLPPSSSLLPPPEFRVSLS